MNCKNRNLIVSYLGKGRIYMLNSLSFFTFVVLRLFLTRIKAEFLDPRTMNISILIFEKEREHRKTERK